jgi:hypothetical protein
LTRLPRISFARLSTSWYAVKSSHSAAILALTRCQRWAVLPDSGALSSSL